MRSLLRRVAAALRAWKPVPDRLAALLRSSRRGGPAYLRLCHELGLPARAAAALQAAPAASVPVATQIRQAALAGRSELAVELGQRLARQYPAQRVPRRDLKAVVSCLAPLSGDTALALIRASGVANAAEPALLLQRGDAEAAARRLRDLAALLGPQRWLLWANLQPAHADKLVGLNRCLAEHGLSPVGLRGGGTTLSVANLEGRVQAPRASAGAPLLSVVMTCYDSATHLDAALRSVLRQDHANLELIAIDDGSRDDTWRRLQTASAADPRIRAVRLSANVGTYAAKNVGLALARGEFVAFQDADDWSHPERFSRCVRMLLAHPRRIAVSALYVRLQDDGLFWSSKVWPLLRWTPNSIVFRRVPVAQRIGAFDEHRFGADSEFAARLLQAFGGRAVRRLAQPLILAARRDNSLMTSQATGLDPQGRSAARAAYQEAWTEELLERVRTGASLHRQARVGTAALIAETAERSA